MKTKLTGSVVFEKSKQTVMEKEVEKMYNENYPTIRKLMRKYKVNVSKKNFLKIAQYSYMYDIAADLEEETCKLNIIARVEEAITFAKNEGKKELSETSIVKVFEKEIKSFKEVRELNKEYVKAVAYHEVGHFILNEELREIKGRSESVSIIGLLEEGCGGVNITAPEIGKEEKLNTLEDKIKTVAMTLAGDIS